MDINQLFENIKRKKSFLCVGLDTDIDKIPSHLLEESDPIFAFNKAIIDATHSVTVAYKPNLAFYESRGVEGWLSLEKSVNYIREVDPSIFIIADAKRGDIGNTSKMYAKAFFENMNFDSVTVAPYMGEDSVTPFLSYDNKWVTLLALTSNKGAFDFQFMKEDGEALYERVLRVSQTWGSVDNLMYVVGATKAESLKGIRNIIPNHFLLVPGVGAQGGSLEEVAVNGLNSKCGLLVNSSRAIIYASKGEDFGSVAGVEATKVQQEMESLLKDKGLL